MVVGNSRLREPVGDFYVHLVRGTSLDSIDKDLTSSTKLLMKTGKPTVISFYDGGCGGCRPCAAQMRHWASTIPNVQFLEVCVESEAVALNFHGTFGFGGNYANDNDNDNGEDYKAPIVVNGFIPSRPYMPVGFGQLGCSGFVISDARGNFVSRKTAAYLQYGPQAFRHVESILNGVLDEMEEERRKEGGAPTVTAIERIPPSVSPNRENERKKQKTNVAENHSSSRGGTSSPTSVLSVEAPSSVGVDAMDEEHQICTDSFNRALKDPTVETLEEVHELLKSHFAHEEELIEKYAISPEQANSPFSALASHRKDHHRILAIATIELDRVANLHNANTSCAVVAGVKACRRPPAVAQPPPPETAVDRRALEALVHAFHVHAETFDSLYEDKIPTGAE